MGFEKAFGIRPHRPAGWKHTRAALYVLRKAPSPVSTCRKMLNRGDSKSDQTARRRHKGEFPNWHCWSLSRYSFRSYITLFLFMFFYLIRSFAETIWPLASRLARHVHISCRRASRSALYLRVCSDLPFTPSECVRLKRRSLSFSLTCRIIDNKHPIGLCSCQRSSQIHRARRRSALVLYQFGARLTPRVHSMGFNPFQPR